MLYPLSDGRAYYFLLCKKQIKVVLFSKLSSRLA